MSSLYVNNDPSEFPSVGIYCSNLLITPCLNHIEDLSEEESKGLLAGHGKRNSQIEAGNTRHYDPAAGISFSTRMLACIVFGLFLTSQMILLRQCRESIHTRNKIFDEQQQGNPSSDPIPILRKYVLTNKKSSRDIWSTTKYSAKVIGKIAPGGEVVAQEAISASSSLPNQDGYIRILWPKLGYVKQSLNRSGKGYYFVPLPKSEQPSVAEFTTDSFCPLLYSGWQQANKSWSKLMYAPTELVVAQQFWNAMQVVLLWLLIVMHYQFYVYANTAEGLKERSYPRVKLWAVRLLKFVTICLLPFSVYISSPGGHLFALLSLAWISIALASPNKSHRLCIGEEGAIQEATLSDISRRTQRLICFEETLGFLCTIGSSLYNFAGHTYVWPHWKRQFQKIDRYFGWPQTGDLIWEENWTTWGLFSGETSVIPPFVPRGSGGSTAGFQQFWLVWSVLPFLYCSYFLCMLILTEKARTNCSKWFQRFAIIFSMLHFLFGTDCVHYRYGRGYRNPHSELFHWTEKWAWRCAILIPIWQNCVSGHWKYGHSLYPILGKLVHYSMIMWAIGFLLFQVLQSDVVNTYQFAFGLKKSGIIQSLGWGKDHWIFFELQYPYMRALVHMWAFYALLHVTGFSLYRLVLQIESGKLKPHHSHGKDASEAEALLESIGYKSQIEMPDTTRSSAKTNQVDSYDFRRRTRKSVAR